jgi:hypothetical protein
LRRFVPASAKKPIRHEPKPPAAYQRSVEADMLGWIFGTLLLIILIVKVLEYLDLVDFVEAIGAILKLAVGLVSPCSRLFLSGRHAS